ncbi:hypothetical protein BDA99DRAFT_526464 [Phascolomyces articulosus]|uniref:Uncharacterized protein n=1 Tax=Phascolomyces articulosus TaxID=60185 RepID=A0AAD5JN76_9FUNG|nr:hypothetical protein BDA99DRAFT_526464 [Phascolomyces articulosus]
MSSEQEVIQKYLSETESPSLSHFIRLHQDFLIQNSPDNVNIGEYWSACLKKHARLLKKTLLKGSKVDWKTLNNKLKEARGGSTSSPDTPDEAASAGPLPPKTNSKTSTPSSSFNKRSRSSSSKGDAYEMSDEMLEEYKDTFKGLDDSSKWDLGDGVYVEDILYQHGLTCTHEHLSHSFILDIDDPNIKKLFTSEQWEEIKSTPCEAFEKYNDTCKDLFNMVSELVSDYMTDKSMVLSAKEEEEVVDLLFEKLNENRLPNPKTNHNEYWIQKTMIEYLEMFRWKVIDWVKTGGSEMDFIVNVWAPLDKVFHDLMVATKRDNTSLSTNYIDNQDIGVHGSAIPSKLRSIRPDLVLFRNGLEYGVGECGKGEDGEISKKEIVETGLHCPKMMKSMLLYSGAKCDNDEKVLRALRVVSFCQFDLRMSVSVLDSPAGYICRLRSTPKYEIFTIPSMIPGGLILIMKIVLKSKLTVENSMKVIREYTSKKKNDEPDVKSSSTNDMTLILPRLQKSGFKKQKN